MPILSKYKKSAGVKADKWRHQNRTAERDKNKVDLTQRRWETDHKPICGGSLAALEDQLKSIAAVSAPVSSSKGARAK